MKDSLVSIIIPSYKNVEKLPNAINSVLNQTYNNIEVIVVDDNNPDSEYRKLTEETIKNFQDDPRIKYIKNEKNCERSFSRNNGAKNSMGKYLMFLDNDDEFFPEKVESQVEILESRGEEYAFCYSNYVRCKNGKTKIKNGETREGFLLDQALMRNLYIHSGSNLMIRREAFFEVNGFDESMNINEDYDLVVRLLSKYMIAYCPVLGLRVNMHEVPIVAYKFEDITNQFLLKEKELIDSLTENQIKDLHHVIGLQLYKFYLRSKSDRKRVSKQYELSAILKVKYLLYLINRKVRNVAYGFTCY